MGAATIATARARGRAELWLLLVAAIWGLTFPLVRGAVQAVHALEFVAWRFAAALLVFALVIPFARSPIRRWSPAALPGVGLGLLMWAAHAAQAQGLTTVPANRTAFLAASSVVMVPLLAPLLGGGRARPERLAEAAVALVGIALLVEPEGGRLGGGEGWVLACAAAVALHVHFLQRCVGRGLAVVALAFFQILGVCLPALAAALPRGMSLPPAEVVPALLYCAVLATVVVFLLQVRHQGSTTPERAALVYATEPFFAALFGFALLGETFTVRGLAGALLLALAVLARPLRAMAHGREATRVRHGATRRVR